MASAAAYTPEFERFFEHSRMGTLAFPKCGGCGRFHWYPMKRCPHCRSGAIEWHKVSGHGRLFSWTIVRHAFDPAFTDKIPYVVALVEFEDAPGVRFVTNLVDTPEDDIAIGMAVGPVFEQGNQPHPRVHFRPAANA